MPQKPLCGLLLLVILLSSGCQAAPAQPSAQPAATPVAQQPSAAPAAMLTATATASPTATPAPSTLPTATPTALPTATPAPTATPQPLGPGGLPFPLQTAALQFGVAAHLFYTSRALPLKRATEAGFGWVRQQIHWSDQEGPAGRYLWGELDAVVNAIHAAKLNLLLSVVSSPRFYTTNGGHGMPKDPAKLGNFVAALTKHYQGKVQAIEIWNEQNLAVENGGRVAVADAGHYVELLKAAYTRIKAVDPSVYVIAAPPSSTGITKASVAIDDMTYYKAMYSYKDGMIRDYFDAQAVHPGGSANPPDTMWPDNPSKARGWTEHPTFYFRHVEDVRALMERYAMADHQIWITEFGWATHNTSPGFEFGNQTSFEEQADYIVGAMRRTKEQYPWVGAMFLWNLNFAILRARSGQPRHEQASFGILNADGSPRPAFLAIQEYLAQLR
jgi:polysaccharide biosynthesis protein PslG